MLVLLTVDCFAVKKNTTRKKKNNIKCSLCMLTQNGHMEKNTHAHTCTLTAWSDFDCIYCMLDVSGNLSGSKHILPSKRRGAVTKNIQCCPITL